MTVKEAARIHQAKEMIGRDILVYCADVEILEHAEDLQNIVLEHMETMQLRIEDANS